MKISKRLSKLQESFKEARSMDAFLKKDIYGKYYVDGIIFDRSRANKPYDKEEKELKKLEDLPKMSLDELKRKISDAARKNDHAPKFKVVESAPEGDDFKEPNDATPGFSMDDCMQSMQGKVDEPGAYCRWHYDEWKAGRKDNHWPESAQESFKEASVEDYERKMSSAKSREELDKVFEDFMSDDELMSPYKNRLQRFWKKQLDRFM